MSQYFYSLDNVFIQETKRPNYVPYPYVTITITKCFVHGIFRCIKKVHSCSTIILINSSSDYPVEITSPKKYSSKLVNLHTLSNQSPN